MKIDVPIQLRSPFSRPSSPSEYLIDVLPAILAKRQMHRAPNLLIFGNRKYRPPPCVVLAVLPCARTLVERARNWSGGGGACARAVVSCRPALARRTPLLLSVLLVRVECGGGVLPDERASQCRQDEERQNKMCPKLVLKNSAKKFRTFPVK